MRPALLLFLLLSLLGVANRDAAAREPATEEEREIASLFPLGVRGIRERYNDLPEGERRYEAILAGLDWFVAHQKDDGSWDPSELNWCDGKLTDEVIPGSGKGFHTEGITGMVISAFLGAGFSHQGEGRRAVAVRRALAFLTGVQDKEGCVSARGGSTFIYNHAFGSLALVEAYVTTGDPALRGPAQRSIDFSLASQSQAEGGWRYSVRPHDSDTSATGCILMPLHLAWRMNEIAREAGLVEPLAVDTVAFEGVRRWMDKMTDTLTGRAGYYQRGTGPARTQEMLDEFKAEFSESMTAIGLVARRILPGWDPEITPGLIDKGEKLLLDLLPQWNVSSGRIDLYYWYYGTIAMRFADKKRWAKWDEALVHALLGAQHTQGKPCDLLGSWDPVSVWSKTDGGRMLSTALAILCLETADRLRPLPEDRSDLLEAFEHDSVPAPTRARILRATGVYGVKGAADIAVVQLANDDKAMRLAASDALQRLEASRGGMRKLVKLLSHEKPEVRTSALRALAAQGKRIAAHGEELKALLASKDPTIVASAARALGRSEEPTVAEALKPLLTAEAEAVRIAAAAAVWRLAQDGTGLLETLTAGIQSKDAGLRLESAEALAGMARTAPAAVKALVPALDDKDNVVRAAAAKALILVPEHRARSIDALAACLKSPSARLRTRVIQALAEAGPVAAPAAKGLTHVLMSGPVALRVQAAVALGKLGPGAADAAAALAYSAQRGPKPVREPSKQAYATLDMTALRSLKYLLPALDAKDGRVNRGAVFGLVEHGSAVVDALVKTLMEKTESVRADWILVAFREMGPEASGAVRAIATVLDATKNRNRKRYAMRALGAIGKPAASAVKDIEAVLRHHDASLHRSAIDALGKLAESTDEARDMLLRTLKTEGEEKAHQRKRAAAARAIGRLGRRAGAAIDTLIQLLRHKEQALRDSVIAALADLSPHSHSALTTAIKEGTGLGRTSAAHAVRRIGREAEKLVPALIDALEVRPSNGAFGDALAAIGKPAVRKLKRLLRSKHSSVRAEAARTLGNIGPEAKSAVSALRRLLKDKDRNVVNRAKRAIEQIKEL